MGGTGTLDGFVADLSRLSDVSAMADAVKAKYDRIDVLMNNAGVFKTANSVTDDGLDIRFVVNVLAPVVLTLGLLPIIPAGGRVVNLSSAAQAPVDVAALKGDVSLSDSGAYAQSKLALTMWNKHMADTHPEGPAFIALNPASLIGTNMVRDAYGMDGKDINIGRDIIVKSALDPEFSNRSGDYFDNDRGAFGPPHPDALNMAKIAPVVNAIDTLISGMTG